jgi:hypothetical protein
MSAVARALGTPKLLFEVVVERRRYARRALLLLLLVASMGAWYALGQDRAHALVDSRLLDVGRLVAAAIMALAGLRAVINLVLLLRRPTEVIRFYNRGFVWERGGQVQRYSWSKLKSFREGHRGIYRRNRPVVQWGALTLVMLDNRVFRLRPRHGDLRHLARAIRPYAAEVTGIRLGRQLRQERAVRIHPRLIVWPGGLQVGKQEFPWKDLNVRVKDHRLIIRAKDKGKVRTVARLNTSRIDNLGGFMELATTTIKTHR